MKAIAEADILHIKNLLWDVLSASDYRRIERLGGLTNHTYRVELDDGNSYVIRLPGEGTEELINRADERVSTQLACDLGIDACMLHFGEKGEKVTCYIEGAQTLCASSFADGENLKKAAEVLRVLHTCGVDTKVPFDVFDMATGYEKIIAEHAVAFFDDYSEIKTQVMKIRNFVTEHAPASAVPCHNDPLCENWVLSASGKMHLIDWEYAGMNDGMWDLADISIEADLSASQDAALLQFYFRRDPAQEELMRFHANKLYLDFLWSLWGKARVPFDGDVMEAYGLDRYIRLKRNLQMFLDRFNCAT